MDGDVAWPEGQHLIHRGGEGLRRVAGQARDQIHVDIVEAGLLREAERLHGLRGGVPAADGTQNAVGHGLRIDGHARRAARADGLQLFKVERVGPAALHGEFQTAREVEAPADRVQQPRHLRRGERGRRAAAHVEAADVPAGAGQQRAGVFDLTEKTVEIRRQKFPEALDRFAHERAVRAARGAERNADIDRKVVRLEQPGGLKRMARGVETQPPPLRRDEIHVAEHPLRVLFAAAAQERLCGELRWPHARQRAPWRRLGQQLHGGKVIALLQNAPRHAHVRLLEPDAARGRGGLAV